jgi:hypothetical protein
MQNKNYTRALEAITSLTEQWSWRNLTVLGRITIVKASFFIKINFTGVNSSRPLDIIQNLNIMLYKFVWRGGDRVSRNQLVQEYTDGRVKMVDLVSYCSMLRGLRVEPGYQLSLDRRTDALRHGCLILTILTFIPALPKFDWTSSQSQQVQVINDVKEMSVPPDSRIIPGQTYGGESALVTIRAPCRFVSSQPVITTQLPKTTTLRTSQRKTPILLFSLTRGHTPSSQIQGLFLEHTYRYQVLNLEQRSALSWYPNTIYQRVQ